MKKPRRKPKVVDVLLKLLTPEGIAEVKRYVRDVEAGADPIEALHGHVCGPDCWHGQNRST